ncbi:SGNH/GDSL hydrolase family protein [Frigidibacter sp. MR17.24]|uniref:SGNH/GDSL hydrolase family protein n=1 Tax=Frigidibacter sp. MR17.24 TaxID=3127345 RepID=UPI003012A07F
MARHPFGGRHRPRPRPGGGALAGITILLSSLSPLPGDTVTLTMTGPAGWTLTSASVSVGGTPVTLSGSGTTGTVTRTFIVPGGAAAGAAVAVMASGTDGEGRTISGIALATVGEAAGGEFVAMPELLTQSSLVVLGDSLPARAFGQNTATKSAWMEPYMAAVGFTTPVTFRSYAIDGATISAITAQAATARTDFPGSDVLLSAVAGGNDISDNRPYPGGATAISTGYDGFIAELDLAASKQIISIPHKRYYSDAPAVTSDPSTEANGSLPYNENIFIPKAEAAYPEHIAEGQYFFDMYPWSAPLQDIMLADGIHLTTANVDLYGRQLLARIAARALGQTEPTTRSGRVYRFGYGGTNRVTMVPSSSLQYQKVISLYGDEGMGAGAFDLTSEFDGWMHYGARVGGSPPSEGVSSDTGGGGTGAFARIADTRLQLAELLGGYLAAAPGFTNEITWRHLCPGDTVRVTAVATRASSATDRKGLYTLTGGEQLVIDGATSAASNMGVFAPITVPADGTVRLSWTANTGSIFGYVSATMLEHL